MHFERNNSHLGLYYTPQVMTQLYELIEDISLRAPTVNQATIQEEWQCRVDYLEALIPQVENVYTR